MVFIVEYICCASFVVLLLMDHQALLFVTFVSHLILDAWIVGVYLFLLWYHGLWFLHSCKYYMLSTPFQHEIYLGFASEDKIEESSI